MSLHSLDVHRVSQITGEETRWALNIKYIVLEDAEDVRNVSDFEIIHHAMVARDDMDGALERLRGLQVFREEYSISDTVEEGMELLRAFMIQQQGFLLTVDVIPGHANFVFVYDNAKIRPTALNTPEDWRTYLGGLYYLFQCMHSNVEACRQGVVHVGECEGMGSENFSRHQLERTFSDLAGSYPFRHKEISWIRTPLAANLMHSFLKRLMRRDNTYTFHIGCTLEGLEERLDGIFHVPSRHVAEQHLQQRLHEYLRTRYFFQKHFRLPRIPDSDSEEEEMDPI